MDKKQQGIYGGIGTGAFGVIMGIVALNTGIANLTGQVEGAISAIFILISIAAFARPDSMGQIAMTIMKNQQKAVLGSSQPTGKSTTVKINNKGNGPVITTVGSKDTDVDVGETKKTRGKKAAK